MSCFKINDVWSNYRPWQKCRDRYQVKWKEAILLSGKAFLSTLFPRHWGQMPVLLVSLQVKGQSHSNFLSLECFLCTVQTKNTLGESRLSLLGRAYLFHPENPLTLGYSVSKSRILKRNEVIWTPLNCLVQLTFNLIEVIGFVSIKRPLILFSSYDNLQIHLERSK